MIQKWKSKNHYYLNRAVERVSKDYLAIRSILDQESVQEKRRRRFIAKQKAIEGDKKFNKKFGDLFFP